MQQKQSTRSRITPAIVPITIPAIAPPLMPCDVEDEVIGSELPEAVAGERNGAVVVADFVEVEVVTVPLVGLKGAEKVEVATVVVATYVQLLTFGTQLPAYAQS